MRSLLMLLPAMTADEPQMTGSSWTFMGLAWLFVILLAVWCFWRVLGGGKREP